MQFKESPFGLIAESALAQIVFFNKNATFVQIQSCLEKTSFHRLHQTHSDLSEPASEKTKVANPTEGFSTVIGDSLIASDPHFDGALGVSTADCLPVMLVSPTGIAAIHAGWRGVENEIILKTLKKHFAGQSDITAFIGPHIQLSSFEVDRSLGEKFNTQYMNYTLQDSDLKTLDPVLIPATHNPQKSFVNLSIIAKCQLRLGGLLDKNIWISDIDTKTNLSWASFRREGKNMGKNLGFVSRRHT
jgi:YfiH family protein